MAKIQILLNITTNLDPQMVALLYERPLHNGVTVDNVQIKSQTTSERPKLSGYQALAAEQRKWIADHGQNLAGYIRNYADPTDPERSEEIANHIWDADITELRRLEEFAKAESNKR